jgi:hypothetical protein
MAIRVFCDEPQSLLKEIKAAVRDRRIPTWKVDDDGDFTHTPIQWENLAWLRPRVLDDRIVFNIVGATTKTMSRATYGVYHGRFIEMLLTHFDEKFSRTTATALPVTGDVLPQVSSKPKG